MPDDVLGTLTASLHALVRQGHESKDFDYKSAARWDEDDKKACCELVKDILGMANTLGGNIVIGVSETARGFSFDGLSDEQAKSFDTTRVNQFVQNYSDPPINALLKKVTLDGRCFVVVQVPRFIDAPHICQKDYPGVLSKPVVYVRTDNNETAPIKEASDFRALIENAVRNRQDAIIASVRAVLQGGVGPVAPTTIEAFGKQLNESIARFNTINPYSEKHYTGYRETIAYPVTFIRERFALDSLRREAQRASVDFVGWPYLPWLTDVRPERTYSFEEGVETLASFSDFRHDDRCDYWRLYESGLFHQRTLMWEEHHQQERSAPPAMDFGAMAIYAAEALHCVGRLYGENLLDGEDEVRVEMRVLGAEGRVLTSFDTSRIPLLQRPVCRMPVIRWQRTLPIAEWRAGVVDLAVEACREVYLRFNWDGPNVNAAREIIEKTLSRRM
jgi:hypothetical protein